MPIEDTVVINISLEAPTVSQQGMGTVLIPGFNPTFSERIQRFSTLKAILDADIGITDADYEYLAAEAVFGQSPFRPSLVAIGRMDAFVAQADTVTIDSAVNLYVYTISVDGVIVMTYAASVPADTVDVIAAGLLASYSGPSDITPANPGAPSADVTLTAAVTGKAFTTTVAAANMSLVNTTPNNGYYQELGDIMAEDNDWYGLVTGLSAPGPARQTAQMLEAARFIAGVRKLYLGQAVDADMKTTATDDFLSILKSLNRRRTAGSWHGTDSEMMSEAWMGAKLSVDPDQRTTTWTHATLQGVTAQVSPDLTVNEQTNIEGKNGNYYGELGGEGATYPGLLADGNYIDTLITEDWTFFRMVEDLQRTFLKYSNLGSKIPYTDEGIQIIRATINNRLTIGVGLGHFAGTPKPEVSNPLRSEIPDADVAARLLRLEFSAQLAGAIHTTNIIGNIAINL